MRWKLVSRGDIMRCAGWVGVGWRDNCQTEGERAPTSHRHWSLAAGHYDVEHDGSIKHDWDRMPRRYTVQYTRGGHAHNRCVRLGLPRLQSRSTHSTSPLLPLQQPTNTAYVAATTANYNSNISPEFNPLNLNKHDFIIRWHVGYPNRNSKVNELI